MTHVAGGLSISSTPSRQLAAAHRRQRVRQVGPPLVAALAIVAFYHTWLTAGVITAGDFPFYTTSSLSGALPVPSIWDTSLSTGQYAILQAIAFPIAWAQGLLASGHLGWPAIERILWIVPAVAVPCTAIYGLAITLFADRLAASISMLAMVLNSYCYILYEGGQFGVALAFGCMPLALWVYIAGQRRGTLQRYILTGVVLSAQALYDIRSTYLTVGLLILYGIFSCTDAGSQGRLRSWRTFVHELGLPHVVTALATMACLHLWWLLLVVFVRAPTLPPGYTALATVQALSHMQLSDSLAIFHPFWFTNNGRIHSIDPLFFVAPFIIVLTLRRSRGRHVFFLTVVALAATFLLKGTNEPAGIVYQWLFTHWPGYSYFRDPSRFYQPLVMAYALLLGVAASTWHRRIREGRRAGRQPHVLATLLFFSLLASYPAYPALLQPTRGTFVSNNPPADYARLNVFIDRQSAYFRVLWAPARPRFATFSPLHPSLDAGQISICCRATAAPDERPWLWLTHTDAVQILQQLSVRYVVIPLQTNSADVIGQPWPLGDPNVAPSSLLAALRASLHGLREFRIGTLDIFALAGLPLLSLATVTRPDAGAAACSLNVACVAALQQYRHVGVVSQAPATRLVIGADTPTWYDVRVHVSHSPTYLVLAQTYDPNWLAFLEPVGAPASRLLTPWQQPLPQSDHVVVYGYANAWLLRRPGTYRIVLEYWPQRLVLLGWAASALFLLCYGGLVLSHVRQRRRPDTMQSAST